MLFFLTPYLVWIYFGVGILFLLLSFYEPTISKLKHHGRQLPIQDSFFYISKQYFVWFYTIGCICGALTLCYQFNWISFQFLVIHLCRRLLETRFLQKTKSQMNLIHFLVGITFYPFVWMILAVETPQHYTLPSLLLWISCYFQFQCHWAMAHNNQKTLLPKYWLFSVFVCPNYTCEILVYVALWLSLQSSQSLLLLIFVSLNQIISGLDRKGYYPSLQIPAVLPML
jgi:hypothetical protein